MAYKRISPIPVVEGGTGSQTFTSHGLLIGAGTSAIVSSAAPSNGQIPIGSTGSDPVLGTITAGNGISVTNGAGSITVASTLDSSAFLANNSSNRTNQTGAGTNVLVPFDAVIYNIGSNYNSTTSIYTAPANGIYLFSWSITVTNFTSLMTTGQHNVSIAGTGSCVGTWNGTRNNAFATQDLQMNLWRYSSTVIVQMNSGDTCNVVLQIVGGAADTATISGNVNSPYRTTFGGCRLT